MKYEYKKTLTVGNKFTEPPKEYAFCRKIINEDIGFMERLADVVDHYTTPIAAHLITTIAVDTFKCAVATPVTTPNTIHDDLYFDPEL